MENKLKILIGSTPQCRRNKASIIYNSPKIPLSQSPYFTGSHINNNLPAKKRPLKASVSTQITFKGLSAFGAIDTTSSALKRLGSTNCIKLETKELEYAFALVKKLSQVDHDFLHEAISNFRKALQENSDIYRSIPKDIRQKIIEGKGLEELYQTPDNLFINLVHSVTNPVVLPVKWLYKQSLTKEEQGKIELLEATKKNYNKIQGLLEIYKGMEKNKSRYN